MCLIVDTNRSHILFGQPASENAQPIWDWLRADGIIIYGGRLASELARTPHALRVLAELSRSGRAKLEEEKLVQEKEEEVAASGCCRSDDPHIIALARASGARVLFTEDRDLMRDFQNLELLRPKGKIYRTARHRALLSHWQGCRGHEVARPGRHHRGPQRKRPHTQKRRQIPGSKTRSS